ncbi:MAG: adenylate/guanylate cyclase domain-containing protein, partial [Bacteroidales bacterium]
MTAQHTHLEKKRATIVCADIGIFSPRDDESIDQSAGLMNTCNDIIESVAGYYGGKVIQFTGKSTILAFEEKNASVGNRNNPLLAAIEIREKIAELSKKVSLDVPLELLAGIHMGPVLLGHIGTATNKQSTVIGETVDITARIRDMANKGQILTSKETYEQNKSKFDFQTLEPVYVKGKSEPIPIYKVLNQKKKEFAPKDQSDRSIYSEMIGRKDEKEILIAELISLTQGEGGIINIIGAPGTGKSRLIEEIKKERIVDQLLWFEGRGLSHGHTLSYHPLAGIIKSWAGIVEEDSPLIAESKLKNEIKKISPEAVESIFPFIARFMGLNLSGDAGKHFAEIEPGALDKMMLKALRELLIKAATRRQFIIAIEDLHWADQSSLS